MSQSENLLLIKSNKQAKSRGSALHWVCIMLLAFTLAACGGGGSGGSDDQSAAAPQQPANPNDPTPTPVDPVPTPPADPPSTPPDPMPTPVPTPNPGTPPAADDQALFEVAVYGLLAPNPADPAVLECVDCHSGNPRIGSPDLSHPDPAIAYAAVVGQQRVNLANPAMSRIYLRAAEDRHNCGGAAACDAFAAAMLTAIQDWAAQAGANNPPPNQGGVVASAQTNFSQVVQGQVSRADANLITMFAFDEGAGDTTVGTSNVGAGMTLNLTGTEWVAEGGLRNVSGGAQASLADSQKLFNLLSGGNQFSVEAWVIPEALDQTGPARIVSYSVDTGRRNFTKPTFYLTIDRDAIIVIKGN